MFCGVALGMEDIVLAAFDELVELGGEIEAPVTGTIASPDIPRQRLGLRYLAGIRHQLADEVILGPCGLVTGRAVPCHGDAPCLRRRSAPAKSGVIPGELQVLVRVPFSVIEKSDSGGERGEGSREPTPG